MTTPQTLSAAVTDERDPLVRLRSLFDAGTFRALSGRDDPA
jgi:hypothetical protein